MKNTTVRLDDRQLDKLELIAVAEEISVSEIIRKAIAKYLLSYDTEELVTLVRARLAQREKELEKRIDRLTTKPAELD
ncbi:ribbon-helix-helix protein, CopG family [Actinosynnema sp. CS-041913]|uniref:ribbon-helix-helix protein, CopG family n=1 Tax=Actinosynnema sp. CS-041913 TaxID=3239917 RepID=UPI003D8CA869